MSLYRHVAGKDDLLTEVADRLLARSWRPRAKKSDWRAWLTEAAERLCRLLCSQPAVMQVYLSHPVVSAAAVARMEAALEVLRSAGADEEQARRAYGSVHTYTIGFAALVTSRAKWQPDDIDRTSSALAAELASYTTTENFATGLGYLLNGIEAGTGIGSPRAGPKRRTATGRRPA
jgi:AcrR family transcriptional regulator